MTLMIIALSLVVAPGLGANWFWAPLLGLLGLCLLKRLGPTWDAQNQHKTDMRADGYLLGRSPRADMERRWSRLGSPRGRLLAGADPQSELAEQVQRLEYKRGVSDYHIGLAPQDRAQAYDLQLAEKRKRKPKRKRLG